jgi:hypothetical protein
LPLQQLEVGPQQVEPQQEVPEPQQIEPQQVDPVEQQIPLGQQVPEQHELLQQFAPLPQQVLLQQVFADGQQLEPQQLKELKQQVVSLQQLEPRAKQHPPDAPVQTTPGLQLAPPLCACVAFGAVIAVIRGSDIAPAVPRIRIISRRDVGAV